MYLQGMLEVIIAGGLAVGFGWTAWWASEAARRDRKWWLWVVMGVLQVGSLLSGLYLIAHFGQKI